MSYLTALRGQASRPGGECRPGRLGHGGGPVTASPRIGILGTARIADEGIIVPARTLGHQVVAVAARTEAFAAGRGIATVHDSYVGVRRPRRQLNL
jgi:hypothetical protein